MGNPHKIDVANMVDQLTTKPEVVSIFNKIIEESGIETFLPELKLNVLLLISSLYLKVRAFSKAKDITNKAKIQCDKHKIKFINQVSLVENTGGYLAEVVGSTVQFSIYTKAKIVLEFKKYLYFNRNFVKVSSMKRSPVKIPGRACKSYTW